MRAEEIMIAVAFALTMAGLAHSWSIARSGAPGREWSLALLAAGVALCAISLVYLLFT